MPNPANQTLLAQLQSDTSKLAGDSKNTALRAKIIKGQVDLTAAQLGVSKEQAGQYTRTYTAAYAQSKNIDPQALLDALTTEEQNVLQYSKNNPKLYGVDLITAQKIAGYLGLGSGALLGVSLILFTIALFLVGPEAAAAVAAGEGVVGTIGAALGSPLIATGGFFFLLSQFLGHLSSGIPMMTKQMIDNGSIGPGLRISALTQAEELNAKLTGSAAPGPFTTAQFTSYANAIEAAGAKGINNPQTKQTILYSRTALAKLITYIYGQEILKGNKTTYTKIQPLVAQYLIIPGTTSAFIPQQSSAPVAIVSTPSIKVFTGVVSQGVLGSPTSFTPRIDDLITSLADLKQAVENNLAPFIAALPNKIVYEIKIVSSVTGTNGFVQHGASHQVAVGQYANGTTKYKTVVNKFAVLNLYLVTDKGSRSKLSSITLGPTDAINFQPGQVDISTLETTIKTSLFTSNPSVVQSVATSLNTQSSGGNSAAVASPAASKLPLTPLQNVVIDGSYFVDKDRHYDTLYRYVGSELWMFSPYSEIFSQEEKTAEAQDGGKFSKIPPRMLELGVDVTQFQTVPFIADITKQYQDKSRSVDFKTFFSGAVAPGGTSKQSPSTAGCNASNLSEWYTAQGQVLPSLSDRSKDYEAQGLGTAGLYSGTAEQNVKLLSALKAKAGCPVL
jgi:hypothetical protein